MNLDEKEHIWESILRERIRQNTLMSSGKFTFTCETPNVANEKKLVILAEEFGEVSREVAEGMIKSGLNIEKLRKELIQVAAVCVAWCEAIDRDEFIASGY